MIGSSIGVEATIASQSICPSMLRLEGDRWTFIARFRSLHTRSSFLGQDHCLVSILQGDACLTDWRISASLTSRPRIFYCGLPFQVSQQKRYQDGHIGDGNPTSACNCLHPSLDVRDHGCRRMIHSMEPKEVAYCQILLML